MKLGYELGTNYEGTSAQLSWCVEDAKDMSEFYKKWGFVPHAILEAQVTAASFRARLKELVDKAKKGEITAAVFSHSGHGTKGYNPEEPDFYDEGAYFIDGIVWDNEVAEIVSGIPEGFPFFALWDLCFSGGLMRLISGDKIKYIQTCDVPPTARPRLGFKEALSNAIVITASSEGEYSYDASDLQNGAGTYYAIHTYKEEFTFQNWIDEIRKHLPSSQYPQTPQLICKEEYKNLVVKDFMNPVPTNIPDIPSSDPVEEVKKNWLKELLKKLIAFFNRIFGSSNTSRVIKNKITTLMGLPVLLFALFMMVMKARCMLGKGECDYKVSEIMTAFGLGYALLMARDSLIEGLTLGFFKKK